MLSASFQLDEGGLDHQIDMPKDLPMPEQLVGDHDLKEEYLHLAPAGVRKYWEQERPIEIKPVSLKHYFSRENYHQASMSGCARAASCLTIGRCRRQSSLICLI